MDEFRFFNWEVYKDSKRLLVLILNAVKKLPRELHFEFGSQMMKASLSVVLNIAEGSGKNSDKELKRFLDIASGSLYETMAGVDVLRDNHFISYSEFVNIYERVKSIARQLGGFKKQIKIRSS